MFEEFGAARMGDIPKWHHLGRTRDGRTREDFEDEEDFEGQALRRGLFAHPQIDRHSGHVAGKGRWRLFCQISRSAERSFGRARSRVETFLVARPRTEILGSCDAGGGSRPLFINQNGQLSLSPVIANRP